MMRRIIQHALPLLSLASVASSAKAAPIYLKSGQCILLGSQEVCAMSADSGSPATKADNAHGNPATLHLCRYGFHPGSEIPNLKNHALFQIVTAASGRKSETLVRQFGINDTDKETCQKEADRLNGESKP